MVENFFLNNQRLFPIQELYNTQEEFKNKPLNVGALLPMFILKMNSAEEISTEKSLDAYKEQRWGKEETSHPKPCKPKDRAVTSLTFWIKMLWIKYSKSDFKKSSREVYQIQTFSYRIYC